VECRGLSEIVCRIKFRFSDGVQNLKIHITARKRAISTKIEYKVPTMGLPVKMADL